MDKTVDLHRHLLVRLTPMAWAGLRPDTKVDVDADARGLWQAQGWPLVVTRQLASATGRVCLGWPLPTCWGRRRISLQLPCDGVDGSALFPTLTDLLERREPGHALPAMALSSLQRDLAAAGVQVGVYGSYGWQAMTGMAYVHGASDLDLLINVTSNEMADAAAAVLARPRPELPRLDGEFCFADGSGFAWREWQAWRSGQTRQILRKHLTGVGLLDRDGWQAMQVSRSAQEVCP